MAQALGAEDLLENPLLQYDRASFRDELANILMESDDGLELSIGSMLQASARAVGAGAGGEAARRRSANDAASAGAGPLAAARAILGGLPSGILGAEGPGMGHLGDEGGGPSRRATLPSQWRTDGRLHASLAEEEGEEGEEEGAEGAEGAGEGIDVA